MNTNRSATNQAGADSALTLEERAVSEFQTNQTDFYIMRVHHGKHGGHALESKVLDHTKALLSRIANP